jgi:pimeloyl-ACP methyl ester carboxylesterase
MFTSKRSCIWASVLLAGTITWAQEDLQSQARKLITSMAAHEYSAVEAQFDSTMHSVLPEQKLSQVWDTLITQNGDFESITTTRQQERQGYQIVFVTCRFAKATLDTKLVFDSRRQVAGLFFVPAKTQSPTTPAEKSVRPADVTGDWLGTLEVGALKLRIVFHITHAASGFAASIDSPDQNASGLPVSKVEVSGSSLVLESEPLNAIYEAKVAADLNTMKGTWKQGMGEWPLLLTRVTDKAQLGSPARPQNPIRPFPYREEDVSYENKVQGDRLAATLTIPQGKGPFPAVLLITGSGPQDRDESFMGHKPFLVLSDYLTRKGIAVLRADDRGIGKSTGNFSGATTADFATDTEAGIAFLKTRPEVNPKMIGLIGHSEGGIIAPMVAARNPDVAFIVMLAGSGVPGDEVIVSQVELISQASGKSREEAQRAGEKERQVLNLLKQNTDDALIEKQLREELAGEVSDAQIGAAIKQLNAPWFRYFISYDPATALRKVKCPVLALNGEKDLQVPPKQNLPAIRKALEAGGNKNFDVEELPGLNHLFQTARSGLPAEYPEIEETISPLVLQKIADWILRLK